MTFSRIWCDTCPMPGFLSYRIREVKNDPKDCEALSDAYSFLITSEMAIHDSVDLLIC